MSYLASTFAKLATNSIIAPFLIVYYTVALCLVTKNSPLGLYGSICIYAYFILSSTLAFLAARKIVPRVVLQDQLEGIFRLLHVKFLSFREEIAMWNGFAYENFRLDESLSAVIEAQIQVVYRKAILQGTF